MNEKYLECRRGRQHSWSSCEGESIEPWLSEELLLLPQQRGVPIRKGFQDKKPGRSSGFGREFGSFQNSPALGQSHKPTTFFVATSEKANGASPAASPAPGHSPHGGFLWGQPDQQHRAVSEWEQHPRSFELLYHRLHTHTHKQTLSQQAIRQHQAILPGARVPAHPRDPSLHRICLHPTPLGQSVLASPASRTYREDELPSSYVYEQIPASFSSSRSEGVI